ncbi:MAG: elongation factor P [Candidatus Omnitrophota bacterium]
MTVSINEIKVGLTVLVEREIYTVVDLHHVKPGKGAAFVRTKLKNLKTQNVLERTFRGDEKIEEAFIEQRKLQFLYRAGDAFHFMDQESFEETVLPYEKIKDTQGWLKDNIEVTALFFKDELLSANVPNFIEFKIVSTETGLRGDSSKAGTKPAKLETGKIVQVPLFIEEGNFIRVDTRSGEYIERA